MELLKIWRIILGYRRMITVLTLSATIIATLLTYALPVKYLATAVVLVRPREAIEVTGGGKKKEMLDFPISHSAPFDAPSKTYMEIIQSRAVAERVVRALELDKPHIQTYDSWWAEWKDILKKYAKDFVRSSRHIFKYGKIIKVSPFEESVEDVQENLKMEAKKNTYIFEITYGSGSPQEAADVANELAKIFLEHTSEADKSETMEARMFFKDQLLASANNLKQAREALKQFKERHQTFSLSEEFTEKLKIITALESSLEKTGFDLAGLLEKYHPSSQEVMKVKAERVQLLRSLAQRKRELETNPDKEKHLNTLQLSVTATESNYKFIRTKFEEVLLKESTNPNEIRIVSPATAPSYPSKPIKYYYGGSALILGLVIGIGWALFRESGKAPFRSVDDVKEMLGTRVLATIPRMKI